MEQEDYLISDTNRVENLVDDIIAEGQPDDMFLMLMTILETTEILPQVGRYIRRVGRPRVDWCSQAMKEANQFLGVITVDHNLRDRSAQSEKNWANLLKQIS